MRPEVEVEAYFAVLVDQGKEVAVAAEAGRASSSLSWLTVPLAGVFDPRPAKAQYRLTLAGRGSNAWLFQ